MKTFIKFLKFGFLSIALSSGLVFVKRPVFASTDSNSNNRIEEDVNIKDFVKYREFFDKYCKDSSEQVGVIRFKCFESGGCHGADAELLFSPSLISEKFGIDRNSFFKNIGCEIESKTGAKYRIRPFFDEFGNNAVCLDAKGDFAQIKVAYSEKEDDNRRPSLENLDDFHDKIGNFEFDEENDKGFELVDGENYRVRLFRVNEVLVDGKLVEFKSDIVRGKGKSSFKPQDVVAEFEAKAELQGPYESLWHILTDKTKSKFDVFSKFKHPEKFDEDYALSLIDFHNFDVQNRIESRRAARRELD